MTSNLSKGNEGFDLDWYNHNTCYKNSVTKKRFQGKRRQCEHGKRFKIHNETRRKNDNSKFRYATKQGCASRIQGALPECFITCRRDYAVRTICVPDDNLRIFDRL